MARLKLKFRRCCARVCWRRRRDSNSRDPFEPNGFQDRRFQPLTHSSGSNSSVFPEIPVQEREGGPELASEPGKDGLRKGGGQQGGCRSKRESLAGGSK